MANQIRNRSFMPIGGGIGHEVNRYNNQQNARIGNRNNQQNVSLSNNFYKYDLNSYPPLTSVQLETSDSYPSFNVHAVPFDYREHMPLYMYDGLNTRYPPPPPPPRQLMDMNLQALYAPMTSLSSGHTTHQQRGS